MVRYLHISNFMTYLIKLRLLLLVGILLTPQVYAELYQPLSSIQQTAHTFVMQHAQGRRIEVNPGTLDARLKLPACQEALQAFLPSGGRIGGINSVGIRCQKPKPWLLYVPINVKIFTPVVTTTHPMISGTRISLHDVQVIEMDIANLSAGYFSTPEQVLNKTLKRPLSTGAVLSPRWVETPLLVRRGEQVMLLAETQGMQIRSTGKALKDGVAGAVIQVRNTSSNRIIEGVVTSAGIVKIIM